MSFVKPFVFIVVVLCFFNHKVHNAQHRVLKVVLIFIKNLKPNMMLNRNKNRKKYLVKINATFFIPSIVPLTPEGGTMTACRAC